MVSPTSERIIQSVSADLTFSRSSFAFSFSSRTVSFVSSRQRDFSSFTGIGVDIQNVYVTTDVSAIVALNRLTGTEVWRQEALRLRDLTAATRFRDTVVVADFEGYLHFLSGSDGRFLARQRAGSGQITGQPLALGPLLLVQSEDGTITALEIVPETA